MTLSMPLSGSRGLPVCPSWLGFSSGDGAPGGVDDDVENDRVSVCSCFLPFRVLRRDCKFVERRDEVVERDIVRHVEGAE